MELTKRPLRSRFRRNMSTKPLLGNGLGAIYHQQTASSLFQTIQVTTRSSHNYSASNSMPVPLVQPTRLSQGLDCHATSSSPRGSILCSSSSILCSLLLHGFWRQCTWSPSLMEEKPRINSRSCSETIDIGMHCDWQRVICPKTCVVYLSLP